MLYILTIEMLLAREVTNTSIHAYVPMCAPCVVPCKLECAYYVPTKVPTGRLSSIFTPICTYDACSEAFMSR